MAKLYVVATPIGNLNDISPRMCEALREADLIAAEDTRVTMKLLNHLELKKPMTSCHRHNEQDRAPYIVEKMLTEDLTVALTCDAGTPGISDPGVFLVREAWERGVEVVPISGPSAVVTAISVSGFDAREFAFFGFLPREKKELIEKLNRIHDTSIPVFVLYESPHRVVELTERIAELWPEAMLCVCSDLTKHYEKVYRGSAMEVAAQLNANPNVDKGEYCMVVDVSNVPVKAKQETPQLTAELYILSKILEDMDISEACSLAKDAGYPRNEIYKAKLKIGEFFEE